MPNRLAKESSAYLRDAAHQPVDWHPWSEEAFARARQEDKPILLDIGAVWCHWCHVLDHESYEDPEVAQIINDRFVAVKVDRDERPDIDARYQQAVNAITGQGGWPLTGFLTPEGRVFYGGTYFPKDDAYGRMGFKRVLLSVASFYRDNKQEALDSAEQLSRQLAATSRPEGGGAPAVSHLETATTSIARTFDVAGGGFGVAPKFPHPSAIEFLLRRHFRTREDQLLAMVSRTLQKMARGGIHDQIGGGFHRYATDAGWIVPHFEKMLYDNAGLLRNYARAYQATHDSSFEAVARDTAEFMATVLADPDPGGFYGSQDADVGPDDDGSYFTWSEQEAKAVLAPDEFDVLAEHYHLRGQGEMHSDSARHVLFIDRDPDVIAATSRRNQEEVERLLARGREKLAASRMKREAPYVDTALYANWNGMAVSAFLSTSTALGDSRYRDLALRTLDRFIAEGYTPEHGFAHILSPSTSSGPSGGLLRMLDDQVQMAQASLDAYEVTAEARYLRVAREVMDVTVRDYWDEPGFLDVPGSTRGPALEVAHKPVQDAPTPSANGTAALVLLRLSRLLDQPTYRDVAERLLAAFAPGLASHGLYAAQLFIALDDLLHEPAHVTIIGSRTDPRTTALHEAALTAWRPDKIISHHDGAADTSIPEVVKAMLGRTFEPTAYVCAGTACAPPATDSRSLIETITSFGRA